jgi:hypothetical protein
VTAGVGGGLPGPIGERFGAFEPRFYGISYVLETPAMFQAWLAHSGVFRGFQGPSLPSFETTCLQTALEHEKRHFHDALLSPFANAIFMLRMMAAFNGMKVFNRGMRSGANCLPIPATTWMAMNRIERDEWLRGIMADLTGDLATSPRPLSLPYIDANVHEKVEAGIFDLGDEDLEVELHAFAKATVGAYARSAELMRGPMAFLDDDPVLNGLSDEQRRTLRATITPRNVFEASALAVQMQAAWTNIGEDAANALGQHLIRSQLGYAKAFRRIAIASAPADRPSTIDLTRVSAVAVWCLLGDLQRRADFDPAVRLERVLKLLTDSGGIATTESIADLWDEWDASTSGKPWRTCVTEMSDRTARSRSQHLRVTEQLGESQAVTFGRLLDAYIADQTAAIKLLLDDPGAYVNTLRYVETVQNQLPTPLLSVELGEFVAPLETFPVNDAVRLPRIIDRDGLRGWNRSVVDSRQPPRPALLDAALDYEFTCKLCDLAFSDEALNSIDKEVLLKSIAESTGLTPLFVF